MVTVLFIVLYLINCCKACGSHWNGYAPPSPPTVKLVDCPKMYRRSQQSKKNSDGAQVSPRGSEAGIELPRILVAEMDGELDEASRLKEVAEREQGLAREQLIAELTEQLEVAVQLKQTARDQLQSTLDKSEQEIVNCRDENAKLNISVATQKKMLSNANDFIEKYQIECKSLRDRLEKAIAEKDVSLAQFEVTREKLRVHLGEIRVEDAEVLSDEDSNEDSDNGAIKQLKSPLSVKQVRNGEELKEKADERELLIMELQTKRGAFRSEGNVRIVFSELVALIIIGCTGIFFVITALILSFLCNRRCNKLTSKQKLLIEIGSPRKTCDVEIEYNAEDRRDLDFFEEDFAQSQKLFIENSESKLQNEAKPKDQMSFLRI